MFVSLVKSNDKEIAFRRSFAIRTAILLIIGAIDTACYWYFSKRIQLTPVGENEYVWCIPILIIIVINVLILKYAGPDDIILDIGRQTYAHVSGFPLFPRTSQGTFGDFYGLCVRGVKNRRGAIVVYSVELDWNKPGSAPLVLAESTSMDDARERQRELALRLVSIPVEKD